MISQAIEFEEVTPEQLSIGPEKMLDEQILDDLVVDLQLVAGHVELSVAKLFSLRSGDVMTLQTAIDAPIQLMYQDRCVAEGMLVVQDDKLAVRVLKAMK